MQLLAGLTFYLTAMSVLVGGGVAAFLLFVVEPAGGRASPVATRQASVPPKIAASLERRAERYQPPAKTSEPAQPVAPVAAEPPRPSEQAWPLDDGAVQQRPVRTKQKPQRAIVRRAPAPGGELALGYAPTSSRAAYTATIFHRTDRGGD
jgi:hypothetical protein